EKLQIQLARERQEVSEEERRLVMQEIADSVGLSPPELDAAIRGLKNSEDFGKQGLAALYEQNYPKAEELLTKSYEISKPAMEKAVAKFADDAFFLGQAKYERGKYSEAIERFQEVALLRK